ncbi:hypothetical protein PAPYR_11792 [Paratrimastix pyriformis]|uniref:Uncharacterized protein n=1 Tax=Paratrimastix pyriformis TaxID=342808 RepID=A0ABQ8U4R6_9EUKA|nr:hypothetical protein PAPYR_11792 [Paratrimastix pyriformis]
MRWPNVVNSFIRHCSSPEAIFVFRTQPSPVGVLGERDLSRDEASPASRGGGEGEQSAGRSAYAAAGTTAGGAGPGPYQSAQAGEDHPTIGREPESTGTADLSQTEVVSGFAGDPRNGDGETEAPPPHYWIVPDGPVECRQLDRAAPHDSRAMSLAHGERISLPATGVKPARRPAHPPVHNSSPPTSHPPPVPSHPPAPLAFPQVPLRDGQLQPGHRHALRSRLL